MVKRIVSAITVIAAVVGMVGLLQTVKVSAEGDGPNPSGNNGTIKINGQEISSIRNDSHVTCQFKIDFFNYDESNDKATVSFELQSPTKNGRTLIVSGNTNPSIGEDPAGDANDLDASETYTLAFTGAPQQNQGYHVKVTVSAPGTQGRESKSKVFWVTPCEEETGSAILSAALVCNEATHVFTLTVSNSGTASADVVLNEGEPKTVEPDKSVTYTLPDDGSGVKIKLTSDEKVIGEFDGIRSYFCKQGQGSIGGTVTTEGQGGQGAATGVASLPFTGNPVAQIVSLVALLGSVGTAIGGYVWRHRGVTRL